MYSESLSRSQMEELKANHPTLESQISVQNFREMKSMSNGIKGVLDSTRMKLKMLEEEIRADNRSKAEFERRIRQLTIEKEECEERLKSNGDWMVTYETEIGPFTNNYENLGGEIGELYENAKRGHARGIEVLKSEFGYHPAYKTHDKTFYAVPFKPK